VDIRELRTDEKDTWLGLRELLWPDFSRDDLTTEQAVILDDPHRNHVFVSALESGELVGFVEVSLRDWAEGCSTHPVGYIEAWYVKPRHRRGGVGRRLIEAAERWATSRGCVEMGSDAELGNEVSRQAHGALGYTEVIRAVLFRKRIQA
jgi:aminoglycoside 6'-N-acetyltransferase I